MARILRSMIVLALLALPAFAQTNSDLAQAQQVLALADSAGAQQFAKSLYDDASYRIRFAQENINSTKSSLQEQARMRAREALFTARAALAKARWAGTNAAIRNLQTDITRFGGRSDLRLQDEDPNINLSRGSTSKERIATAQAAIDQAKAAGAEQSVADNDLKTAQDTLNSANKVTRNGRDNNDVADHLAYVAEMIARRAYYLARFNESARALPDIQLQRTRLAQSASEQQASAERTQREAAERQAAQLQQQLAAQEANRQAQAAELDRLRSQVDENRRAMQQRMDTDRAARVEAERRLDDAMSKYEAAVATGSADSDTLRRQVEDAEIALRAVQERERLDEEAMGAEVNTLRSDITAAQNANPPLNATILSQRQADLIARQNALEQFRTDRQADVTRRADIQRRHEAAVAAAMQQRQQAEQQAQAMRQQIEAAQAAAQQAAAAAQSAQQQVQSTQQQLQTVQQQAQQQQAEAEKAREDARRSQEELERTRQQLAQQQAQQQAEARQREMESELARLAQTKRESRGFVVTLPGIFFDTGKSALKPGAKSTLTRIAAQLKGNENLKIAVEGHTDSVGSAEKNAELSEKRAEAVRDFLVSAGVPGDRITAAGKGEADPVATNKTTAGRQQNRRVELVITQ